MAGFLDVNFDSDEDFEETAGRGDGGRADPAGDGGRERGRGVGVGRGLGGRAAVGRGRGGAPGHEGGHIAPRGAKKEEAFGGVILKSERPSGALFTNSGPPFFTVESKIEVLSPLGTSFH